MKKIANLRVCASCEWIFKLSEFQCCPKCGFAHYGAYYVYGNKCYKFAKTQEPWFENQLLKCKKKLWQEISAPNKVLHADAAMPPSAEPLSGLGSVPAVESDTQPRW